MTIEKKFRAWDRERKIMTESFGLKDFDGDYFIPDGVMLNDENSEIMQYTGLKDKNGIDIYEADKLKDLDGNIGVVEFDDGSFIIRHKNGTSDFIAKINHFEIVGNKFDGLQKSSKGDIM